MITDPVTIQRAILAIFADPSVSIDPKDYRAMTDFRRIILSGGRLTDEQTKYASGMIDRYAFGKRKRTTRSEF